MWGLEYALLFGVPNNKLELIDGRSRCAFPFRSREQAEAHFAEWSDTLRHWKGVRTTPAIHKAPKQWRTEVQGFQLTLYPLPIDLRVPFDFDAFLTFDRSFWRRDLWSGQPIGQETGWEDRQRHYDVQINLWSLLGDVCQRHGGIHSGRVDISLSETTNVAPDQFYFRIDPEKCLLDDYFHGIPDLIAEVLSPATREVDRGMRRNLYRRAGVPHLWLLDPEVETVEIFELTGADYRLAATHGTGDKFRMAVAPDITVDVDDLFRTQWKRHFARTPREAPEPVPNWLVPAEIPLGLEYLFLLGHPERRTEIWGNRAPCVLAFGSAEEARVRLAHFLEEASRWEQVPAAQSAALGPDVDQAEVGRFRFTRRDRHVYLDVAVDARKYQEMLRVWSSREVWDWGEE